MCGKDTELYNTAIEGTHMSVCKDCAKYGTILNRMKVAAPQKKKPVVVSTQEISETVVGNIGELLKRKREALGMSQKDFASKIAEKESSLHKMETGTLVPTMERARKLEKMLGLKLVEEITDELVTEKKDTSVMTLGDFVKIRKKSK